MQGKLHGMLYCVARRHVYTITIFEEEYHLLGRVIWTDKKLFPLVDAFECTGKSSPVINYYFLVVTNQFEHIFPVVVIIFEGFFFHFCYFYVICINVHTQINNICLIMKLVVIILFLLPLCQHIVYLLQDCSHLFFYRLRLQLCPTLFK